MDARDRIADELRRSPHGLDARELAGRLGLHPNTIRWHLGVLAREGAVSSRPEPNGARGRPRIVYRLQEGAAEGTREEYKLLATVLSGSLAAAGEGARAEESGRAWGRYLVDRAAPVGALSDEEAAGRIAGFLDDQGFATEVAAGEIRMRRCPFRDLAASHPEIVCAAHRGLVDGALTELGSHLEVTSLDVLVEPDLCVARLG